MLKGGCLLPASIALKRGGWEEANKRKEEKYVCYLLDICKILDDIVVKFTF